MSVREIEQALREMTAKRNSPAAKALGARMRNARRQAGLKVQQVAAALSVTPNFVYHAESGAIPPSAATVARYAQVVGTDPATLLGCQESIRGDERNWPTLVARLAEIHGTDAATMPPGDPDRWPPGPRDHLRSLLVFGIWPTGGTLAEALARHPALPAGPADIQRVIDRMSGRRNRGFLDWYLAATDTALDVLEDVWQRQTREAAAQANEDKRT